MLFAIENYVIRSQSFANKLLFNKETTVLQFAKGLMSGPRQLPVLIQFNQLLWDVCQVAPGMVAFIQSADISEDQVEFNFYFDPALDIHNDRLQVKAWNVPNAGRLGTAKEAGFWHPHYSVFMVGDELANDYFAAIDPEIFGVVKL